MAVGCANTQHTENLLSAAGFRTVIANCSEPFMFSVRYNYWWYADAFGKGS
jgi:hypothetical protein